MVSQERKTSLPARLNELLDSAPLPTFLIPRVACNASRTSADSLLTSRRGSWARFAISAQSCEMRSAVVTWLDSRDRRSRTYGWVENAGRTAVRSVMEAFGTWLGKEGGIVRTMEGCDLVDAGFGDAKSSDVTRPRRLDAREMEGTPLHSKTSQMCLP